MELDSSQPFELIETMVHTHRLVYLDQHLQRLRRSADFFEIPLPIKLLRESLSGIEQSLRMPGRHKVRLTVRESGDFRIEISPLTTSPPAFRSVCISPHRIDASQVFFYHKTTRRSLYNNEYNRVAANGYYEVLFLNQDGQLAEGSRSNLFLRIDGVYYTPALSCGLLPGVYRQLLLNRCPAIQEKTLVVDDLKRADRIYLSNAVAGLVRVHRVDFT